MIPRPQIATDSTNQKELIALVFGKRKIKFSKAVASKLVGGEYRLEKLIMAGEIRADKPTAKQNGKWHCNGADVIRHIRL